MAKKRAAGRKQPSVSVEEFYLNLYEFWVQYYGVPQVASLLPAATIATTPIAGLPMTNAFQLRSQISTFVDLVYQLRPTSAVPLYVDLEGIHLSRNGTISLMSIFVPQLNHTFLVDIFRLQERAFTIPGSGEHRHKSLKTILEAQGIPKVFFDVRNDADALFSLFKINLKGVIDLQLMEVAARPSNQSKTLVSGFRKAVLRDTPLSPEQRSLFDSIREEARVHFAPEAGGTYHAFEKRPIDPSIIKYCKQQVGSLPGLYAAYSRTLDLPHMHEWRSKVRVESRKRVKDSQAGDYVAEGRHKILGPWPGFEADQST